MRGLRLTAFIVCTLLTSASEAREFNLLATGAIELGGDAIAEEVSTNGDKRTIRAGGLFYTAVGTVFQTLNAMPQFETQVTLGWKFDFSDGKNADFDWDRYPIELLQFHKTENWRWGGGITYHLNPKITLTGTAPFTLKLDDALGIIIEIDHISNLAHNNHFQIGARITLIDYENQNTVLNGNSIGLNAGLRL